MTTMRFEPVLITQLVAAALALVAAFGVPVDDQQRQAIIQFTGVVVAIMIGSGLFARNFVWSANSVDKVKQQAFDDGAASAVAEIR